MVTLTCDISQSGGTSTLWRAFTTSDTSGSPVASLATGVTSPPYNYPTVQPGDTVAIKTGSELMLVQILMYLYNIMFVWLSAVEL